jgi:hypothetical protein
MMEAGNLGTNPAFPDPDYIDDLQLLTTAHNFLTQPPLTTFGDTSASAALAARYAAMVWAKYPALMPETVRGLMVHSAEWTPAMLARFTNAHNEMDYRNLVRCFGHGVPNLRRLLSSFDNSLTLVAESEIQPFFKENGVGAVKTREMRPHRLPWPSSPYRPSKHECNDARYAFVFRRAESRRARTQFAIRISVVWTSLCRPERFGDRRSIPATYQQICARRGL